MKLISRRQWGARTPRSAPGWITSTRGVKVHYTGSLVRPALVEDHKLCAVLMGQIQNGHMDGNGWSDIGYTAAVCPHGDVFEGRGLNRLPAANGPGLNSGHYAVLAMVGNAGLTRPTPEMLAGIRDAVDWLRQKGGAGPEIRGHRDGYATDCPGPALYAWIRDGAPRPQKNPTEELVKALPVLKRGATGEDVQTLQALLIARSHPEVKLDGTFDAITDAAVRAVQRWGKVAPDGIVGPATWSVLLRLHL